jgi:hypothetical protein
MNDTSLPPPTASTHKLNWPFLNIRITSKGVVRLALSGAAWQIAGHEDDA